MNPVTQTKHYKYCMLIREILSELTFMGSPCTKDCSGHKAGYEWGIRHKGRTAKSWSNSFNNGTDIAKQKIAMRPQGGGKLPGYVSQTPSAVRKRAQRAARPAVAQPPQAPVAE